MVSEKMSDSQQENTNEDIYNDSPNRNSPDATMNAPIPKKAVSRPAAIDVQMVAPFHPSPSTPNLPGDNTFLSPPRNTFTSRPPKVPPRPSSAPPATTEFDNQYLTPTYGQDTPRTRGLRKGRRPTFAQGDSGGSSVLSPPPPPLCTS